MEPLARNASTDMSSRNEKWAALTTMVESGDFEERFLSMVAEGNDPTYLASNVFNLSWFVVRRWIESSTDLMQAFESAKRAGADKLMYEALHEVRNADVATVQLAKLRADRYDRMAGKLDRKQWGDKVEISVEQTINIVDVLKEARGRVLEGKVERVPEDVQKRTYLPEDVI